MAGHIIVEVMTEFLIPDWWFEPFVIFPYIGRLLFFRGVETTNQILLFLKQCWTQHSMSWESFFQQPLIGIVPGIGGLAIVAPAKDLGWLRQRFFIFPMGSPSDMG